MRCNLTLHVCLNAVAGLAMLSGCGRGLIPQALAAEETHAVTPSNLRITVAVVGSAHVAAGTLGRAEREASRILEGAGLSATWLETDVNSPIDLPPDAIVLRIEAHAGPKHDPKAIGVALAPELGDGVYATIFFDRVRQRAADAGLNVGSVLGHAIAHEIGHLLLGTNSHSGSGLMSAVWTASELRSLEKGQLNFVPDEAAKMHGEVVRRNGERIRAQVAKADEKEGAGVPSK